MIDAVQLFRNSICSLPSMRPVDILLHLELFVTVAPDLRHVNCTSKHQINDMPSIASARTVTRREEYKNVHWRISNW